MTILTTSDALDGRWFTGYRPKHGGKLRLFCFPHAGGSASSYHHWRSLLPGSVDVCLVQLPGRAARINEAPFTRLKPLVLELARVMRQHLDMPFAFFGHSMGALIAFELARLLQNQHKMMPECVLVSARRAPHLPPKKTTYNMPEPQFSAELRRMQGM